MLRRFLGRRHSQAKTSYRPGLEVLRARVVPAVGGTLDLNAGLLTIIGTEQDDRIEISRDAAGNIRVESFGVAVALAGGTPTVTNLNAISILGGLGDDTITINQSSGLFAPGAAAEPSGASEIEFTLDGELGFDSLTLFGLSTLGDVIDIGTSGINLNADADADLVQAGIELATINTQGGNDTVNASGSSVVGGAFPSALVIAGGTGNDKLVGGDGDDEIQGNAGADQIAGGLGHDTLAGNEDNDSLQGGLGDDLIGGGSGVDRIIEVGDVNWVFHTQTLTGLGLTGQGADALDSIEEANLTGGESGNVLDAAAFSGSFVTLAGMGGGDLLIGGVNRDALMGGDGSDTLLGNQGDDFLDGRMGDDSIVGGDGNDSLFGSEGNDTLTGGQGNDVLFGGSETDRIVEQGDVHFAVSNTQMRGLGVDFINRVEQIELTGGASNNVLNAGRFTLGPVTLHGGAGNDRLIGGKQGDQLAGEDGNDTVNGGAGNDTITGGLGADLLNGLAGDDFLDGGDGLDTLIGGLGNDLGQNGELNRL